MSIGEERERSALTQQYRREISRQRIDYAWQPDGRIRAVLTLTLAGGKTYRVTAHGDPYEIAKVMLENRPEVGGFLGKMWGGIKKVAKKVANTKVFKAATKVLSTVVPIVGPAAAAAKAALGGATKLLAAKSYAAKGDKASAAKLIAAAKKETSEHPPPVQAQAMQTAQKLYTLLLKPA